MQTIYTADDIEQIAYGIHDLHNLFKTWAAVGEGIESIREGDHGEEMATMFSLAFDQATKLNAGLRELDKLADAEKPGPCYDEIQRRMADLEDSHKNAPVITANRLKDWHVRLGLIGNRVSAALATVERVREVEDLDWQASAPLLLVVDALNQCDDDGAGLQMEMHDFIKAPEQEGDPDDRARALRILMDLNPTERDWWIASGKAMLEAKAKDEAAE